MQMSMMGLLAGLLLAIVAVIGGLTGFLLAIVLGGIGYVIGAHFDGQFNLSEVLQGRRRG